MIVRSERVKAEVEATKEIEIIDRERADDKG